MKFTKMHGAGNDYIYIDARSSEEHRAREEDWPQLSRSMSHRHYGVGGDGIILLLNSDIADLKMRMFNADGSEGEMCGNGIRCFTKYAIDRAIVATPQHGLTVETLAGVRTVVPRYEGDSVTGARVAMGKPGLNPQDLPVSLEPTIGYPEKGYPKNGYPEGPVLDYPLELGGRNMPLTFVSMGNPHAVTFMEEPVADFPLHTIGPQVEHHPMFPSRVNFEVVNINSQGRLNARVWERGSGETMACGTGACAIAVAARLLGIASGSVDITLPGGALSIDWDGQGEVFLEGDAEEVFSGEWSG
ncbi:MAG: diaminopimelate epimerase [SAR202 cluster bacterium Io17-Chloro-G9]|nr:MAG: diaminopimelate epimerase [SAR202 cluster bacterium Io17-Chloro-G9]